MEFLCFQISVDGGTIDATLEATKYRATNTNPNVTLRPWASTLRHKVDDDSKQLTDLYSSLCLNVGELILVAVGATIYISLEVASISL